MKTTLFGAIFIVHLVFDESLSEYRFVMMEGDLWCGVHTGF